MISLYIEGLMLKDRELQVLYLMLVDRLSLQEIANQLEISKSTIQGIAEIARLRPIGDLLDAIYERRLTETQPETLRFDPSMDDGQIKEKF